MAKLTNWQKFDNAFKSVSAYVVMDTENNLVAKVSVKYPKDGAGRLTAFIHLIGTETQVGTASGYGYDKRTAAICNASDKFDLSKETCKLNSKQIEFVQMLSTSLAQSGWKEAIQPKYGFNVIQVI